LWGAGIATGFRLDGRGLVPVRGKIFITSSAASRPALRYNKRLIRRVLGTVTRRVKRQGHEADHLLQSNAEVKKGGLVLILFHMYS
jgi:hypothetical protein